MIHSVPISILPMYTRPSLPQAGPQLTFSNTTQYFLYFCNSQDLIEGLYLPQVRRDVLLQSAPFPQVHS